MSQLVFDCNRKDLAVCLYLKYCVWCIFALGEKPDIARTFQVNSQTLSVICQTPTPASPVVHAHTAVSETTMDLQVSLLCSAVKYIIMLQLHCIALV